MEDKITTLLKSLKSLKPREEFLLQSKRTIVAHKQEAFAGINPWLFTRVRFVAAFSFAALLIVFATIGTGHMERLSPVLAESINVDTILAEAQTANFQLHIEEVRYYAETADQVAVALSNIADEYQAP